MALLQLECPLHLVQLDLLQFVFVLEEPFVVVLGRHIKISLEQSVDSTYLGRHPGRLDSVL